MYETYKQYSVVALGSFFLYITLGCLFPKLYPTLWAWIKKPFQVIRDIARQPVKYKGIETFWDGEEAPVCIDTKNNEQAAPVEAVAEKCEGDSCGGCDDCESQIEDEIEAAAEQLAQEAFKKAEAQQKLLDKRYVLQEELKSMIKLVEDISSRVSYLTKDLYGKVDGLSKEVNANLDFPNMRLGAMVRSLIGNDGALKEKFAELQSQIYNLKNHGFEAAVNRQLTALGIKDRLDSHERSVSNHFTRLEKQDKTLAEMQSQLEAMKATVEAVRRDQEKESRDFGKFLQYAQQSADIQKVVNHEVHQNLKHAMPAMVQEVIEKAGTEYKAKVADFWVQLMPKHMTTEELLAELEKRDALPKDQKKSRSKK